MGSTGAPDDEAPGHARAARELGARWVVTGGWRSAPDDVVRVTAWCVTEVETGTVVQHGQGRTAPSERSSPSRTRLQAEFLRPALRLDPRSRARRETHVVEAYEAFAKGMLNLRIESYEALTGPSLFFERAVALDPGYARACTFSSARPTTSRRST